MNYTTIDRRTDIRTHVRNGAVVSVNRETKPARIARLIEGAAALRRKASWGDFDNARAFLRRAREMRTS